MSEVSEGIILILIAAFFQGTYALFLKFMNCWKWENFWTVFSFISLVISPVLLCSILVPNFIIILASSSVNTIAISFSCGILWGIGSVLFSLSIMRIGLALTYSLIIGLTASIGSLLPLLLDASHTSLCPRLSWPSSTVLPRFRTSTGSHRRAPGVRSRRSAPAP